MIHESIGKHPKRKLDIRAYIEQKDLKDTSFSILSKNWKKRETNNKKSL